MSVEITNLLESPNTNSPALVGQIEHLDVLAGWIHPLDLIKEGRYADFLQRLEGLTHARGLSIHVELVVPLPEDMSLIWPELLEELEEMEAAQMIYLLRGQSDPQIQLLVDHLLSCPRRLPSVTSSLPSVSLVNQVCDDFEFSDSQEKSAAEQALRLLGFVRPGSITLPQNEKWHSEYGQRLRRHLILTAIDQFHQHDLLLQKLKSRLTSCPSIKSI